MKQHTRRHYRIVNPVRFFIFILIVVLFVTFAGFSIFSSTSRAEASAPVRYEKVVIQQDDTLWNIAGSYNPEVSDIRGLVHEIYDYNGIDANNIQPGDIIYVPVY